VQEPQPLKQPKSTQQCGDHTGYQGSGFHLGEVRQHCCRSGGLLTVKPRRRPVAPIKRRILSSGARGADTQPVHGPLQRLLDTRPGSAPIGVDAPCPKEQIRQ
jgi:hypothetical protein